MGQFVALECDIGDDLSTNGIFCVFYDLLTNYFMYAIHISSGTPAWVLDLLSPSL